MQKYPQVQYEKANAGSGAAALAVADGTALIGDLSRELQPQENPEAFTQVLIALDGIAVIVSDENPVTTLSMEQLADIFTGKVTNWAEVGGVSGCITVVGRESSSGTRSGFEEAIGRVGECCYQVELSEAVKVFDNRISVGSGGCVYCVFIAKYLERMGYHITNICEWILYRFAFNRRR